MVTFSPKRIDIEEEGLAKVLGTLESEILDFIWNERSASARIVCDHLNLKRPLSFNAVNTVLGRLVDKGILQKRKSNGCFQFTPKYTRSELYDSVSHNVLSSLLRDKSIFSIASFAEALHDLTPDEKKELRKALDDHAND